MTLVGPTTVHASPASSAPVHAHASQTCTCQAHRGRGVGCRCERKAEQEHRSERSECFTRGWSTSPRPGQPLFDPGCHQRMGAGRGRGKVLIRTVGSAQSSWVTERRTRPSDERSPGCPPCVRCSFGRGVTDTRRATPAGQTFRSRCQRDRARTTTGLPERGIDRAPGHAQPSTGASAAPARSEQCRRRAAGASTALRRLGESAHRAGWPERLPAWASARTSAGHLSQSHPGDGRCRAGARCKGRGSGPSTVVHPPGGRTEVERLLGHGQRKAEPSTGASAPEGA